MSPTAHSKPRILVVEDNLADAKLTAKLLGQCDGVEAEDIQVVGSGTEALDYLMRTRSNPIERPNLVFLDLNLPGLSGLELLQKIREDDKLHGLPTLVLSSSTAPKDVQRAYELRANAYLRKPVDLHEFRGLVGDIEHFWLRCCRLPN